MCVCVLCALSVCMCVYVCVFVFDCFLLLYICVHIAYVCLFSVLLVYCVSIGVDPSQGCRRNLRDVPGEAWGVPP